MRSCPFQKILAKGMVIKVQVSFLSNFSFIAQTAFVSRRFSINTLLLATLTFAIQAEGKVLCTIIAKASGDEVLLQQGDGCSARVTPASTTKIPLAVMGFDSGFLEDPHTPTLPFKKGYVDWLGDIWKQPTDPTRWLKYSVVWYSQLVTHKLGQQRVEKYASDFGFGNADFSGNPGKNDGLDFAWISSSLEVSAQEQVAFIRRLINRELPVAADTFDKVYQSVETWPANNGWTIHGKTGAASPRMSDGSIDREKPLGWFVGWANKGGRSVVFAKLIQDEKKQIGSTGGRARDEFLVEFSELLGNSFREP